MDLEFGKMNIEVLMEYFDADVIDVLKENDYDEIYDKQFECIKSSIEKEENTVLSLPTGSGKTFPAILTAIYHIIEKKGKVVYVAPLKALAREKYNLFKKIMEPLSINVEINTGDYANYDYSNLGSNDIVIATTEKLDSLIRHDEQWLYDVSLFIMDEIHTLSGEQRGLTLELVITEIKIKYKRSKILALSAVIGNPKEMAKWLKAKYIEDTKRLVQLNKGVMYNDGEIRFDDSRNNFKIDLTGSSDVYDYDVPTTDREKKNRYSNSIELIKYYVEQKKKCVVFVNSRDYAEKLAKALADNINTTDRIINISDAKKSAEIILDSVDGENKFWDKMISCLEKGICFHHAGVPLIQRELIEDEFSDNNKNGLMVIVATTTLAQGINFPASVVLVADCIRWMGDGWKKLNVNEVINMIGRAGRLRFHDDGIAILIEDNQMNNDLYQRYIEKDPEDILSKLKNTRLRRKFINGFISTNNLIKEEHIIEFFTNTFYATLYKERLQDWMDINESIKDDIDYLKENDLIDSKYQYFYPTKLGRIVSESCIDCETGIHFKKSAENIIENVDKLDKLDCWHVFQTLLLSTEISMYRPYPNKTRASEIILSYEKAGLHINEHFEGDNEYFKSSQTAQLMCDWVNEKDMDDIIDEYHEIKPHDLLGYGETIEWLGDSFAKISNMVGIPEDIIKKILSYCRRARHGVKEDILEIVKIEGIGRKSARKLYEKEISYKDLGNIEIEKIEEIIGSFKAKQIKNHFTEKKEWSEEIDNQYLIYSKEIEELEKKKRELEKEIKSLQSNRESEKSYIVEDELNERLEEIKDFCERQLNYIHSDGVLLRFFTNHGTAHSRKVQEWIEELVNDIKLQHGETKLTQYEYYLLSVSSWCHDLGMLPNPDEDFDDIEVVKEVRKNHSKRIEPYLKSKWSGMGIKNRVENNLIITISKNHSGRIDLSEYDLTNEYIIDGSIKKVRIPLLISLLRLADELDMGNHRLPPHDCRTHPEISEEQKIIYVENEIIKDVLVNHKDEEIVIQLLLEEEIGNKEDIKTNIYDNLKTELDIMGDILGKYGIYLKDVNIIEISY